MRGESPIVKCLYGWGQEFWLYANYLKVGETSYPLGDLTYIRPIYRHIMGISSVRLELRFGKQEVTLRGIAAMEEAQKVIDYLTFHYMGLQTFAQATTAKVAMPNWQRFRQEQHEQRQRRIHVERSLREHGIDIDTLSQRLQTETLPEIPVPLGLLADERAHYSTEATLCDEPVSDAIHYTYPAKEHGTLILTNQRLIYIGRKSQIVLDYGRLLHVSRLRGTIAFQAEHWSRREIFAVPHSLECIMFLEHILQRFQQAQQVQAVTAVTAGITSTSRYSQFNPLVEEAPVAVAIDTTPLSQQQWDRAEVIDRMNG